MQLTQSGEFERAECKYEILVQNFCGKEVQDTHDLSFESVLHGTRGKLRTHMRKYRDALDDYKKAHAILSSDTDFDLDPDTLTYFRGQEIPPLVSMAETFCFLKQTSEH